MDRVRDWRKLAVLVCLVGGLAAIAAGCGGGDEDEAAQAPAPTGAQGQAVGCSATIGLMSPVTGPAASIGEEILNWANFGLDRFNEENGTDFEFVVGDTMIDPAQASTIAEQFVSNDDIVAVVGPAGSQEVEAAGPQFTRAGIPFVSMSATRTSLTLSGDLPTFFRVVPRDDVQGPTDARFMVEELDVDKVFIIDDQSSYSTGLSEQAGEVLEDAGVNVVRESVNQQQTDFSALVSRVDAQTDVVFLPWQIPANGQTFYEQMQEQGKKATIFGADGFFNPTDYRGVGSYVSTFAPDIREDPDVADLVEAYKAEFGDFGTFGPPTFTATQVVMEAISRVCQAGSEPTREAVLAEVEKTNIGESIMGSPIRFDENGDVVGGRFFIFMIEKGPEYKLIK